MKKYASLLAAILCVACTQKQPRQTDTAPGVMSATETPEAQAEAIYDVVIPQYQADTAFTDAAFQLRSDFCTREWTRLEKRDMEIMQQTQEMGAIDYDVWIGAQDWSEDLAVQYVKRFRSVSEDTVWVNVGLTNCGEERDLFLVMVQEHGLWRIDDFPLLIEGEWYSPKESRQIFISQFPSQHGDD